MSVRLLRLFRQVLRQDRCKLFHRSVETLESHLWLVYLHETLYQMNPYRHKLLLMAATQAKFRLQKRERVLINDLSW